MLLELLDGGIVNIESDRDYVDGCETCDYGNSYINEFSVELVGFKFKIKASQMYEYKFSEDFIMKLFLRNVDLIKSFTELEFIDWLKENFKCNSNDLFTVDVDFYVEEKNKCY